jgi:RNA-directed DNA polymerase
MPVERRIGSLFSAANRRGPDAMLECVVTPDLQRFTKFCGENTKLKFNSVVGLLFRPEGLEDSYHQLPLNKAPGIDQVRKEHYADDLGENIQDLSGRLRRGSYKPQPVRRVFIPKASGSGRRALGIPAFEDRLVQDRASQILQAIWEPTFLDCSYGFRPERSAHDALRQINDIVMKRRTKYVVEVDIKGFFDHLSHEWLLKFLEHRVEDQRFLLVLRRFLQAGVMQDGVLVQSDEGTPQGGLVSPVLSNIYLHYVLDLWFTHIFSKQCEGQAHLVRYCDDFVAFFDTEADAKNFLASLSARLARFDLQVEPSKTSMLRFCVADGVPKSCPRSSRSFNFLGFTHYIKYTRRGFPVLGVKTHRKRMLQKIKEVTARIKRMRMIGGRAMVSYAILHLRGHLYYYGVSGNSKDLANYARWIRQALFKWLNRRSQRKSYNWSQLNSWLKRVNFPVPQIRHSLWGRKFVTQ